MASDSDVGFGAALDKDPDELGDALDGDMTRFATQPIIEGTWTALAPVVADPPAVIPYEPGTMGPDAANALMKGYHGWIQPIAGPSDRPA